MEGLIFGILRYENGDMLTNKACTGPSAFKSFLNVPEKLQEDTVEKTDKQNISVGCQVAGRTSVKTKTASCAVR